MRGSNPRLPIKTMLIGEFYPVGNRKREDMGMDKKDIADVALAVIVALCFPPAILLPPFNEFLKENETEE